MRARRDADIDEDIVVRPHPLRVRPLGSQLLSELPNMRETLGVLARLSDQLLLLVLGQADAESLARCACVSHALRVLCYGEDLWRTQCLEVLAPGEAFHYDAAGWRATYVRRRQGGRSGVSGGGGSGDDGDADDGRRVASRGCYYSDILYAPWFCGTAALPSRWSRGGNIERVSASELSLEEFVSRYERPGVPVILTGLTAGWAASRWTPASLRESHGEMAVHVGGTTMQLSNFLDYSDATTDEQPLYLFDRAAFSSPRLASSYELPAYFAADRDLFASLPAEMRPDHRWLIVGGTRSGSSWHIDPNASSAWNAVLYGEKKWVLTPPGAPPPGVTASDDQGTVTSPISLYEWFRVFYDSLAAEIGEAERAAHPPAARPREATLRAGELLFVPAGWWHAALNLRPTAAVTQNYAPHSSARRVLEYLAVRDGELASGIPEALRPRLHLELRRIVRERWPEELAREPGRGDAAESAAAGATERAGGAANGAVGGVVRRAAQSAPPPDGGSDACGGGFLFGFG